MIFGEKKSMLLNVPIKGSSNLQFSFQMVSGPPGLHGGHVQGHAAAVEVRREPDIVCDPFLEGMPSVAWRAPSTLIIWRVAIKMFSVLVYKI